MSYAVVHESDPIELHKVKPPTGDRYTNLISTSYKDIELELYLRISNTPFNVIEQLYPYSTFDHNEYPLVRYDVDVIQYNKSIQWLQKHICNLDVHRSVEELSEIDAFKSLIHDKLIPASEYIEYCIDDNYSSTTQYTYAQHTAFPINKYLAYKKRQAIQQQSRAHNITSLSDAIELIESSYQSLYTRLSNKGQFYPGKLPSTLDILLSSVITIHLHTPIPINPAKEYLNKRKGLIKFNTHMMSTYWSVGNVTSSTVSVLSPVKVKDVDEQLIRKTAPEKRSLLVQAVSNDATSSETLDSNELENIKIKRNNFYIFIGIITSFIGYAYYKRDIAQQDTPIEVTATTDKQ